MSFEIYEGRENQLRGKRLQELEECESPFEILNHINADLKRLDANLKELLQEFEDTN